LIHSFDTITIIKPSHGDLFLFKTNIRFKSDIAYKQINGEKRTGMLKVNKLEIVYFRKSELNQ